MPSSLRVLPLGRRVRPDLITLDLMMRRKNGWDALREIKASVELRDIPVVVVSVAPETRVAIAVHEL